MFGALQGLDVMVTRLELPGVWMRWAVLLSLVGLPVAVALSWIFDWTSAGVVRTARASEGARALAMKQRTVTWLALAFLLGGIAWLAWRDHRYRAARSQLDDALRLPDEGKLAEALALALAVGKTSPSAPAPGQPWPGGARVPQLVSKP